MRIRAITALNLLLLLAALPCWANNTLFLPGDAYFPTILTEDKVKSLQTERDPVFDYRKPLSIRGGFLCGYAGYGNLEFTAMPDEFKHGLRDVYHLLRRRFPKKIEIIDESREVETDEGDLVDVPTGKKLQVEINGFSLLFYNTSFDGDRHRLGVRYNEDWVRETVVFGYKKEHVRLDSHVRSPHAVVVNWRDAGEVERLTTEMPQLAQEPRPGKAVMIPVKLKPSITGDHPGIRVIVLAGSNFDPYFGHAEGYSFFEVTEHGYREFTFEKGKWSAVETENTDDS